MDAIDIDCPACLVSAGERCTAPSDNGRREVNWFHLARIAVAEERTALERQQPDN